MSSYLFALRTGTNVLAIHGLNFGKTSSDFLVHPELIATEAGQSAGTGYLLNPTPGADNGAGGVNDGSGAA